MPLVRMMPSVKELAFDHAEKSSPDDGQQSDSHRTTEALFELQILFYLVSGKKKDNQKICVSS